ncbi:MAG: SDR family oxidoreductase [Sphingomonadaceae bacterium]|nr:SDR family oxidoreductase [Sphingomonadaceae bacterium]
MLARSDMTGKIALVTGAAGGLGGATALRLADLGADIAIADISAEGLEETATKIRAKGRKALELPVDLTNRGDCASAVERTVAEFGRIDALCNIAGILLCGPSETFAEESWDLVIKVNLEAPFFLSRAAIPHMLEKGGGIVNVCSTASFKAQAYFSAYCASKAGLLHLTKTMAVEYIKTPIRINAVAPGGMETPLIANVGPAAGGDPELFGRLGNPRGLCEIEDVADTVAFLATPAARSYHGACINIDAGEIVY